MDTKEYFKGASGEWFRSFRDFVKKNPACFICSLVYYLFSVMLLGWQWWSFLLVALVYAIAMSITFSSVGEWLMRLINQVRRLETAEEKNYLRPLFQDVYDKAKTANPELGDIDLCIIDSMAVNACALGNRTIAVTKGAKATFSEDELKAVLAHEMAHIINRDTTAALYAIVGNGIFTILILPIKLLCSALQSLNRGWADTVATILSGIIMVFLFLMQIALSLNSRKSERRADDYTIAIGYGADMVSALYLLEKIHLGGEGSMIERLLASHPRVTARIERLEVALGIQDGE